MTTPPLPVCRHRSGPIGPATWRCTSPKVVTPGQTVTSEMCACNCAYVDHETDPRFSLFSGGASRFLPGSESDVNRLKIVDQIRVDLRPELLAIGMLTAPRPVSTLITSLRELRQAGFGQQVHLFAEPGSNVQGLPPDVTLCENECILGEWGNWRHAASRLLELSNAPWLLLCEDDIRLRCDAAYAVQALLNQTLHEDWGYASLYTPWHNIVGQQVRNGWQALDVGAFAWGALACCFSRQSLQAALEATPPADARPAFGATDILVSHAFKRLGRKLYFHLPSLCEHAGAGNSTLGHPALDECDAVDFDPQRREYCPSNSELFADRSSPSSLQSDGQNRAKPCDRPPVRVAFIAPVMLIGGVEMWLAGLVQYANPRRVKWHVGVIHSAAIESFTEKQIAPFVTLVSGITAIKQLVKEVDIVLVWSVDRPREWIGDFAGPVVAVSHGSCKWTETWINNARDQVTHFTAVSRIAATRCYGSDVRILENGVDPDRCRVTVPREQTRTRWGLQPNEIAVGFVGRIAQDKNCIVIGEAVTRLGGVFRPVFVGPSYDAAYVEQVRRSAPNGIFVAPMEQIGNAFAALDVVVMVSPQEGGPLAVLEAMLAQVPVVATPVGLIPDILRRFGDLCLIVPMQPSPEEVGAAIVRAISPEWRRIVPRAAEVVRDYFTSQRMADDWTAYFEELVSWRRNSTLRGFA